MKIKNTRHGSGGSHFGAFGRQIMLLAPEGDGAGAAAPAIESTATTTGEPATAPAAAPSEKMLPQSQVNTLIVEAKRQAREAARKEFEPAAPKPKEPEKAPPAPTAGMMSSTDVQQLIARERAFERGASGIDGGRLARMEAAFRADNPSDVSAWTKAYREDMGFDVTTPAQPAAPAAPPQATEAPKPAATAPSAPTSPVSPTTQQGMVDLFALTEQQLGQLGPAGLRQHFEAALTVGRQQSGVPQRPKAPARK